MAKRDNFGDGGGRGDRNGGGRNRW
jgi:hypothetical protein